jgi:predicted DNA-binding protein YlxM (UPF0122 family)
MNIDQTKQSKINQVLNLYKKGFSKTEISEKTGVPRSTIFDWITGRKKTTKVKTTIIEEESSYDENDNPIDIITEQETDIIDDVPLVSNLSKYDEEKIKDFISSIRCVQFPPPPKPKTYSSPNRIALVIGDTHFGVECWDTLNIFLQTVDELRPEKVILNGDTVDLLSISRYSKDPRHTHTLNDEIIAYHKFLKLLHDITEPYQTEIIETNGNHSGNGVEGRWWRYISSSDDIKQLLCIPTIAEGLSYSKVFHPHESWSRIKLVDSNEDEESIVELPDGLFVMHGDVVRKNGGFSARGTFEKRYASTITNHTHRIGSTCQRIPRIGSRPDQIIKNYENGCACKLNPTYVSGANWQNGFSIVNYSEGITGVETVVVHNKKATICSLGKTIKVC